MKLINNIDFIRLYIPQNTTQAGQESYQRVYFPKNVVYRDAKVSNIFTLANNTTDGYTGNEINIPKNAYITLYNKNGEVIINNLDYSLFTYRYADCVDINDYIDWEQSYITVTDQVDTRYIYMYVVYSDSYVKDFINTQYINITIPAKATLSFNRLNLSTLVDSKNWGYLTGIDITDKLSESTFLWMTLYDKKGRTININSEMLLTKDSYSNANNPLLFNYLDIDYQQSEIVNNLNQAISLQLIFSQK